MTYDANDLKRAADLADITKVCNEAYADASREGYADNSIVIAAVVALKETYAALVLADADLTAAKSLVSTGAQGFLVKAVSLVEVTRATWRADRATRAAAAAYSRLRAVTGQAPHVVESAPAGKHLPASPMTDRLAVNFEERNGYAVLVIPADFTPSEMRDLEKKIEKIAATEGDEDHSLSKRWLCDPRNTVRAFTCSICGKRTPLQSGETAKHYGNLAQPINDGICCDHCRQSVVNPARDKYKPSSPLEAALIAGLRSIND